MAKEKKYPNGYTSQEIYEYNRNRYMEIHLRILKDDYEIIKKLESVPSKNKYILELIRQDIAMND